MIIMKKQMFITVLLLINSIQSKILLDYPCQTNDNCTGRIENSICVEKKCICQVGYQALGRFRCVSNLRLRRQISLDGRILGSTCQTHDQCRRTPVDGTKICLNNQCQCTDGYVPIDSYRCLRDLEQSISNQPRTDLIELKDPPGYGSSCKINSDCQQMTIQLQCLRGTCICLEGYVPLGKYLCYHVYGENLPVIESSTTAEEPKVLNSQCSSDDVCRENIAHSYCLNGKCTCIEGYQSTNDETCIEKAHSMIISSKSLLGGTCQTKDDCRTINARCLDRICICPERSFPIDDWNCLRDSADLHPSLSTSTSSSTTNFNWWPWSTSSSSSINNSYFRCLFNQQCHHLDVNSYCKSGRCICNVGYQFDFTGRERKCVPHVINVDDDCD